MLSYLYTLEYDDGQRQSEEEIKGTQQQRQEASSDAILPLVSQSLSASVEEASSPETASPTASSPLLQASSKDISPAEARHAPHERLMNNVLVYALADKYDIPELKTLAKAKFSTLVGSSLEDLSTTANAVFTTTPASDLGLRDIVINVCSESVQAALDNESIVSTMEEQGSFALGVLRHIVGRLASVEARLGETLIREDVLRADLANSEKDKKGLAKQAENALREEEEWWLSRLDSVLNSAGAVEKCRHCRIGFFGHLKRIENSATPAFQVTCAKCGTGGTKYSL